MYYPGDFNLDLLKSSDPDVDCFEEIFLSNGLYPVISLATHKRSNLSGTCIDNTFTTDIESVIHSGTIEDIGSSHSPIYSLSHLNVNLKTHADAKQTQYYSFSKQNIDRLINNLKANETPLFGHSTNNPDFSCFVNTFNGEIDKACKLEKPKTTKRNAINNPWITLAC